MALGGGEGLEFGHFRQSFILKGCDHLAQGCAPRATLGVCRVWESTLKGVASVFSFTVVNRTLVEKTVCTRILASDCGMTARMRSGGVRLQPFQGWENVGAQTQGSARRATLGFVIQSRWDYIAFQVVRRKTSQKPQRIPLN